MYKLDREKSKRILEDLKLREIHLGLREGKLTGDPFIDKNWVVNFVIRDSANFNSMETLYNVFKNIALTRLNDPSVYIYSEDKVYTYGEILDLVDKTSESLWEMGYDENSKFGIFINNTIEEVITLLALSKIGALQKYVDFMKSVPAMKHSVDEVPLDALIMDECFLPLDAIVNDKKLPVIVANTKTKEFEDTRFMPFNKLYEKEFEKYSDPVPYIDGKNTITINSTGTTGDPKPIMHSDFTINSAAKKVLYMDYPVTEDNVMVKMIPAQIGLGLITSLYTGLISGALTAVVRGEGTEDYSVKLNSFVRDYKDIAKRHNLNEDALLNIFTAPIFVRALVNDPEIKDLSHVGSILAAGSKMQKKDLEKLHGTMQEKNCFIPICNGYGQNEVAGAATLNGIHNNLNGSGGYPTIGTNMRVLNQETFEVLGINEEGIIVEDTDTLYLGYDGMPEKTEESKITLPDGTVMFNTYDLGYMNEQGFFLITGRLGRAVTREDFKVSMDVIEGKLKTVSSFSDCGIITHQDDDMIAFISGEDLVKDENLKVQLLGDEPVLLSLEDLNDNIVSDVHNLCARFEIPDCFIVLKQIPYKNGKVDYTYLKKLFKQNFVGQVRKRTID